MCASAPISPALESGSRSSHGWGATLKPDQLVGLLSLTVARSTIQSLIPQGFSRLRLSRSLGTESLDLAGVGDDVDRSWLSGGRERQRAEIRLAVGVDEASREGSAPGLRTPFDAYQPGVTPGAAAACPLLFVRPRGPAPAWGGWSGPVHGTGVRERRPAGVVVSSRGGNPGCCCGCPGRCCCDWQPGRCWRCCSNCRPVSPGSSPFSPRAKGEHSRPLAACHHEPSSA